VINKGTQQRFPVLEFAAVATGQVGQRVDLSQGYIGQGVGLEIGPHILDRVQFRGIGGAGTRHARQDGVGANGARSGSDGLPDDPKPEQPIFADDR
jgi:hypothetical protein